MPITTLVLTVLISGSLCKGALVTDTLNNQNLLNTITGLTGLTSAAKPGSVGSNGSKGLLSDTGNSGSASPSPPPSSQLTFSPNPYGGFPYPPDYPSPAYTPACPTNELELINRCSLKNGPRLCRMVCHACPPWEPRCPSQCPPNTVLSVVGSCGCCNRCVPLNSRPITDNANCCVRQVFYRNLWNEKCPRKYYYN